MAMACLVDRAPCLPSRMWSISSRTNSPAWVVGAFPARAALRALLMVFFSGIVTSVHCRSNYAAFFRALLENRLHKQENSPNAVHERTDL